MNYNSGEIYGYDQYVPDTPYLDRYLHEPDLNELKQRDNSLDKFSKPLCPSTYDPYSFENIIKAQVKNSVREQVESYFDNHTNEIVMTKKPEGFIGNPKNQSNEQQDFNIFNDNNSLLLLIFLVVIMFILNIFQYAQAQALHSAIMNQNTPQKI